MIEQLALLNVPATPKLTDRQQAVLDALERAGHDGLDADFAGAIAHELKTGRWQHSRDDRCRYCAHEGKAILKRLAALELATYRRRKGSQPGAWLATSGSPTSNAVAKPEADGSFEHGKPVAYGVIPF